MILWRTNAGINKMEPTRMTDAIIKSAKVLRRLYSTSIESNL